MGTYLNTNYAISLLNKYKEKKKLLLKLPLRENYDEELCQFLEDFKNCPICGRKNDEFYLTSFYDSTDEKLCKIIARLRDLKHSKERNNIKIVIGVPCCECFSSVFGRLLY